MVRYLAAALVWAAAVVWCSGCGPHKRSVAQELHGRRVELRLHEAMPSTLRETVKAPASSRVQAGPRQAWAGPDGACRAVSSILEEWDGIPMTSASWLIREQYAGLWAVGYDAGDAFAFELHKADTVSRMVLLVAKESGQIVLLNYQDEKAQ